MGKRGPKPLTAEELAKRGSWRAKKRTAEETAAKESAKVPDALGRGVPHMPRHLSKEAKEIWHQIVPDIDAMGLLTTADGVQLAELCSSLATAHRLRKMIDEQGASYPVTGKDGAVTCYRKRPEVGMLREAQGRCDRLAIQFGLTPASRSKVEVTAAYTSTVRAASPPAKPGQSPTQAPAPGDPAKPTSVIDGTDRFFRGG